MYLNGSLRQDYVSNLPRGNRTFLYPSVGLGFVLTEAVKVPQNVLTFAKLRASYAEVGQQPDQPYATRTIFAIANPTSGYLSDGLLFPFQGLGGLTEGDVLRSQSLKAQNTSTAKFGADLRFWNSRVTVDYTYFIQKSNNQIFAVPSAVTTGYSSRYINAGKLKTTGQDLSQLRHRGHRRKPLVPGAQRPQPLCREPHHFRTLDRAERPAPDRAGGPDARRHPRAGAQLQHPERPRQHPVLAGLHHARKCHRPAAAAHVFGAEIHRGRSPAAARQSGGRLRRVPGRGERRPGQPVRAGRSCYGLPGPAQCGRGRPGPHAEHHHTQKYLSQYIYGSIEAYNDYGRTGFPVLRNTQGPPPRRFPYPQSGYDTNRENVPTAPLTNGVWWDDGSED